MTLKETKKLFSKLSKFYRNYYKDFSSDEAETTIACWLEAFQDVPFEDVNKAVTRYIATDTKGYPPMPGQITKILNQTRPGRLTESDAVLAIQKAAANSTYHFQEEFAKLPPILQSVVGNPGELYLYAQMNASELSFAMSNVRKSFRAINETYVFDPVMSPESMLETHHTEVSNYGN